MSLTNYGGQQDAYPMMNTNYGNGMPEITDMHSFLAAVDKVKQDLQTFKENVSHISTLQDRVLNNIGDRRPQTQLDDLKSRTSQLSQSLRDDIKKLQSTGSNSNEGLVRTKQADLLKDQFVQALERYMKVEQNFKDAQREQVRRQFKTIKPNATDDEIRTAIDDNPDGRIFQQALLNSDQLGQARQAYRAVQDRHQEVVKIAQTMNELQRLMNDMAIMVQRQGEQVDELKKNAAAVENNMEMGLDETSKARTWAQKAREKRVLCFWISIIIIIIIALAVGLKIGLDQARKN